MADTQARQPLTRILLKISGEALARRGRLRHRSRDPEADCGRDRDVLTPGHPGCGRHRRRQHLSRRGAWHGPAWIASRPTTWACSRPS